MDEPTYKLVKMMAIKEDKTVAQVLGEAVRGWMASKKKAKRAKLSDLPAFSFGPGNERLSEQIDDIVYGERN